MQRAADMQGNCVPVRCSVSHISQSGQRIEIFLCYNPVMVAFSRTVKFTDISSNLNFSVNFFYKSHPSEHAHCNPICNDSTRNQF
jgi:hypothetical protein